MIAKGLTPILNISNFPESLEWFEKLGWTKGFGWGTPATFGSVCSGKCQIFLCQGAQGGRNNRPLPKIQVGDDPADAVGFDESGNGVWISVWVEDVDAIHKHCLEQGIEVTWPPTDEPWGVREMHVRHPDGHVFRISQGSGDEE
jgi:catechol 2,3-dioxygenase-like lactoylglutathione lyase family enzyme